MNINDLNEYDSYKLVSNKVREILDSNGYETTAHRVTFTGDRVLVDLRRGDYSAAKEWDGKSCASAFILEMARVLEETEIQAQKEEAERTKRMKYELWNDGALLETFDTLDAAKIARCLIRFHKGYTYAGSRSSLDIKIVDETSTTRKE